MTEKLTEGDLIKCLGIDVEILSTPCHTAGHIAYFIPNLFKQPIVFCGDTLFVGGKFL